MNDKRTINNKIIENEIILLNKIKEDLKIINEYIDILEKLKTKENEKIIDDEKKILKKKN